MDLIENFLLYDEGSKGTTKLVAKNHQFLGVKKAIEKFVVFVIIKGDWCFWHTQGSGKTYSMVFFAQKGLAKDPGQLDLRDCHRSARTHNADLPRLSWNCGAVTEEVHIQAESGEELKQFRCEKTIATFSRLFRSSIQKAIQRYPMLSDRSDIIVITDEAHRTQYHVFADKHA